VLTLASPDTGCTKAFNELQYHFASEVPVRLHSSPQAVWIQCCPIQSVGFTIESGKGGCGHHGTCCEHGEKASLRSMDVLRVYVGLCMTWSICVCPTRIDISAALNRPFGQSLSVNSASGNMSGRLYKELDLAVQRGSSCRTRGIRFETFRSSESRTSSKAAFGSPSNRLEVGRTCSRGLFSPHNDLEKVRNWTRNQRIGWVSSKSGVIEQLCFSVPLPNVDITPGTRARVALA
jgi:hypothetical protein